MQEEVKNTEELGMETDYLETIKHLKANTVSKEDYMKLKDENKQLLNSLVNGETLNVPAQEKQLSTSELRTELFSKEHTNLETVELALKLRQSIINEGGQDPFLPYGEKIVPTNEDIECANRVAEVFQDCVDYAEGDSEVFTNELMRRTVDTAPRRK